MKLAGKAIESFLRRPDPKVRAVLVYGEDGGLIRERADQVAASAVPDLKDPFRVTDVIGAALVADPARLSDEMAALAMLGGRRLVRVRDADDKLAALCTALFAAMPGGDTLLVVEAGSLGKTSKLRSAFENAELAAALPCYTEDEAGLARIIGDLLAQQNLGATPDAQTFLAENLVGDRMVARGEIAKLALYLGADATTRRQVDLADVRACIGDSGALEMDEPGLAAADGDSLALDRSLGRLFAEGISPVPILRSAQRHLQRLHLAAGLIEQGESEEKALAALKPPLFFKQKTRFAAQLRRWPPRALRAAMDRLVEAEAACKRTHMPDETIAARTLFQIAALARSRRTR
ncbi:MAG: DNA polymerase III subunit delta [Azospirillaceae bacterium]|nr:DNA polymerase III subunit delta [Azospirillaceae bacterium]